VGTAVAVAAGSVRSPTTNKKKGPLPTTTATDEKEDERAEVVVVEDTREGGTQQQKQQEQEQQEEHAVVNDDDEEEEDDDDIPEEILERYELHERIGQGAFSVVVRATDRRSGDSVAIKVVSAAQSPPNAIDREIRNMRRVPSHPAILKLYDAFRTPKVCSFA
jgi:hypothetical protein